MTNTHIFILISGFIAIGYILFLNTQTGIKWQKKRLREKILALNSDKAALGEEIQSVEDHCGGPTDSIVLKNLWEEEKVLKLRIEKFENRLARLTSTKHSGADPFLYH